MLKQLLAVIAVCSSLAAPAWAQVPRLARDRSPAASRSATGRKRAARTATASRARPVSRSTWALNGENFLWRVPYGGRSAPIVMGNRVYVQNPSGRGDRRCRSA